MCRRRRLPLPDIEAGNFNGQLQIVQALGSEVQTLDEFCTWLVEKKRAASNPVIGMRRLNTEIDVRHRRRALTAAEIIKLVQSARESNEEIQYFDGETRARIHTGAYMTGLRRNEIGSLTPESFDLATEPPTITVKEWRTPIELFVTGITGWETSYSILATSLAIHAI